MKLEVATFRVEEVKLASRTRLENRRLDVNESELIDLLAKDRRIKEISLEVAHPGEPTRIIHPLSTFQVKRRSGGAPDLLPKRRKEVSKKFWFFLFSASLFIGLASPTSAQEKVRVGLSTKLDTSFYLVAYAAEEKGFWKENGLDVDPLVFQTGQAMFRAVVAKELFIVMDVGLNTIQAAARGIPAKMVSDLDRVGGFFVYVPAKSPIREPKDLKGARIGLSALGGAAHAYGLVVVKALGIEKEVKFVGTGGVVPMVAALKVGAIDATVTSFFSLMELKIKGEVRDLVSMDDYVPKPWLGRVVWAHKEFIKEKPEVTRRMVKAILQAVGFWKKEPSWATAKIKGEMGISEEAAREIFKILRPTEDGRIEKKALENAREFLIENKIIPREKAPTTEELYTEEFVRLR